MTLHRRTELTTNRFAGGVEYVLAMLIRCRRHQSVDGGGVSNRLGLLIVGAALGFESNEDGGGVSMRSESFGCGSSILRSIARCETLLTENGFQVVHSRTSLVDWIWSMMRFGTRQVGINTDNL